MARRRRSRSARIQLPSTKGLSPKQKALTLAKFHRDRAQRERFRHRDRAVAFGKKVRAERARVRAKRLGRQSRRYRHLKRAAIGFAAGFAFGLASAYVRRIISRRLESARQANRMMIEQALRRVPIEQKRPRRQPGSGRIRKPVGLRRVPLVRPFNERQPSNTVALISPLSTEMFLRNPDENLSPGQRRAAERSIIRGSRFALRTLASELRRDISRRLPWRTGRMVREFRTHVPSTGQLRIDLSSTTYFAAWNARSSLLHRYMAHKAQDIRKLIIDNVLFELSKLRFFQREGKLKPAAEIKIVDPHRAKGPLRPAR